MIGQYVKFCNNDGVVEYGVIDDYSTWTMDYSINSYNVRVRSGDSHIVSPDQIIKFLKVRWWPNE